MKYLSYLIAVLMLPFAAASCGQKYDDYYTQAVVTLQVPDTIVPVEMQGTVVLKNLSDGRRYTVSAFRAPLPPSTCCVVRICSMPKVRCATEWQTEQNT